MKQLAAIVFSLLLIVTQTLAVALPVGSGAAADRPGCCGDHCQCQCCFSPSEAPATPPAQAPASVAAQSQFALPPTALVLFTVGSPVDDFFLSSASAEFRAAGLPLFQRNCALLL